MAKKRYYGSKEGAGYTGYAKKVDQTVIHDWSMKSGDYPMMQDGNGSMNYMSTKKRVASKDARMIRSQMLMQGGDK